ncbi:MAG: hypothetical protein U0793_05330 [Gemmataceae bacterium]
MRIAICGLLCLWTGTVRADDYLTKDGQLTEKLVVEQRQGGFAGFTGIRYTIATDGAWTSETLFNEKAKPKDKGKLSEKEIAALAGVLAKQEFDKLPAKIGKAPGANPYKLALTFGKKKVEFIGRAPPRLDDADRTSAESRLALIWQGMTGLLTPKPGTE